jgi:hypothetical protein
LQVQTVDLGSLHLLQNLHLVSLAPKCVIFITELGKFTLDDCPTRLTLTKGSLKLLNMLDALFFSIAELSNEQGLLGSNLLIQGVDSLVEGFDDGVTRGYQGIGLILVP